MPNITPVILCGGSGTRLWPKSRPERPKPFQHLVGEKTLFERTLSRVRLGDGPGPMVVAGARHLAHIEAQSGNEALQEIIIEPEARNTAPAIALAAARLGQDEIMLVCPSDHYISDEDAFRKAVSKAARLAESGWLVTLGIDPTGPETGFGYIERGDALGLGSYKVNRFVEKPDEGTARQFLRRATFSWNSGIFLFTAGTFLRELEKHRPQMALLVQQSIEQGRKVNDSFCPARDPFAAIEGESIDYAVMENAERVAVVPVSMGWNDIGNWEALYWAHDKDADGNAVHGQADFVACTDVFVMSDGPRVSAIGLEDVVIVVDGDEVLVTSGKHAQKVGQLKGARGQ